MPGQCLFGLGAQTGGTFLDQRAGQLRHLGGRGLRTRAVRKNMDERQIAGIDQRHGIGEHLLGLGRETGDHIGAETDIRTHGAHLFDQSDGIVAQMAPLHPFKDHIVAMLKTEVQIRCETFFLGKGAQQGIVNLGSINGGKTQALQVRHQLQDARHQMTKLRITRQVAAPRGQVNAGEHHFVVALRHQFLRLGDNVTRRRRARIAAAIGDDAEGAAVIAAILHFHESAGTILQTVDQMTSGFLHREDIVDDDAGTVGCQFVGPRLLLVAIADDEIDLGHIGEGIRIGLRSAAGDDQLRLRIFLTGAPNGLTRLTHGLAGDGAGIKDDGVVQPVFRGGLADDLALITVQATAEGDDIDFTQDNSPSNSTSIGPVMMT